MRTPELIATHTNTDFDAFAAMVAAHKLYPEARICLGGAVNRNVREFQALYADLIPVVDPADVERDSVRRLVLVDTVHANRLGELGDLCGRDGVQVVAFDHHAHPGDLPDVHRPRRPGHLGRRLPRHPARAHHRRARHPRDAVRGHRVRARHPRGHRLAHVLDHHDRATPRRSPSACARAPTPRSSRSGSPTRSRRRSAARWRRRSSRPRSCRSPQASVLLSALHEDLYVEGVSVVAHRVMDLTGCDAFFLLVEMENRVFVTARSRGGRLDVAEALRAVGGGGHTAAASAVVKDRSLEDGGRRRRGRRPGAPSRRPGRARSPGAGPAGGRPTRRRSTRPRCCCRRDGLGGVGVVRGDDARRHASHSPTSNAPRPTVSATRR